METQHRHRDTSTTKRILMTGGAGFIGSSLAGHLAARRENEIVIVDNLSTGRLKNIPHNAQIKFVHADVNDADVMLPLMEKMKFDYVFHYASVVGVQRTLQQPLRVLDDLRGVRNVLEGCQRSGVKRIFYASSSEVYGESEQFPQHEERTPLNARLPYAVVKSAGESHCKAYFQAHGVPYTILRFFNTFGLKQSKDFVISKFIDAALQNQPLTVYGDGLQMRTFCYIDDNIEVVRRLLEDGLCLNETINIGHTQLTSILELAQLIINATGSSSEIVYLNALQEGDMPMRQPDNQKMMQILQRPMTSLRAGITKLLAQRSRLDEKGNASYRMGESGHSPTEQPIVA